MKNLYARFVLWLIGPALDAQANQVKELAGEVRAVRYEQSKIRQLLTRWDSDGLPECRSSYVLGVTGRDEFGNETVASRGPDNPSESPNSGERKTFKYAFLADTEETELSVRVQ